MGLHCVVHYDDIFRAISAEQNITNKKGSMAILSNILLDATENKLYCMSTDLEIGMKQQIPAEVIESGRITIPAKKFFELIRESDNNDILIKEKENFWIEIEAGSSHYRLAGMDAEEFPQFPSYDEENVLQIESDTLSEMIDKTFFSIAQEKESFFSLTSALLQKIEKDNDIFIRMVSSDGNRLTMIDKKISQNIDKLNIDKLNLIPRRGVQEIRKFCEISQNLYFGVDEKQITFKNDNSVLIIRLMNGEFPNFSSVIQNISHENIASVDRLTFLSSLKRMNLFTEDISRTIKISLTQNLITLNSQHTEFGSANESFPIEYKGKDIDIAFNCRFFIEVLQVMEDDVIKLSLNNDNTPCVITSKKDDGFLSIIMPMKL